MRFAAVAFALLASCATGRGVEEVRIAATHYQSMVGVKLGSGDDAAVCNREAITGSHVLRWYCRSPADRTQTQWLLASPVRLTLR